MVQTIWSRACAVVLHIVNRERYPYRALLEIKYVHQHPRLHVPFATLRRLPCRPPRDSESNLSVLILKNIIVL